MEWISVEDALPGDDEDVLVCDDERQWVAFQNNMTWFVSHPDYGRKQNNEFGCPFLVISVPTHWRPLSKLPKSTSKNESKVTIFNPYHELSKIYSLIKGLIWIG